MGDFSRCRMNDPKRPASEHRSEPRFPDPIGLRVAVIFDHGFKTNHEATGERALDISEDGIRFYDEWGLPDGALLELQLFTRSGELPVIHYGKVRWKKPSAHRPGFEVGVQFVQATQQDRDAWLAYVRNRGAQAPLPRLSISRDGTAPTVP